MLRDESVFNMAHAEHKTIQMMMDWLVVAVDGGVVGVARGGWRRSWSWSRNWRYTRSWSRRRSRGWGGWAGLI